MAPQVVSFLRGNSSWLRSNEGGAWEDNEIIVMEHPKAVQIRLRFFFVKKLDYLFVYFSGHGHFEPTPLGGNTHICLTNEDDMNVTEFGKMADKVTAIIDACRVAPKESKPYLGLAKAASEKLLVEQNVREAYRQRFNQLIEAAEPGAIYLYACARGETADDTGVGGLFTLSMIEGAKRWANDNTSTMHMTVYDALLRPQLEVPKTAPNQNPRIEGSIKRKIFYPFGVKV